MFKVFVDGQHGTTGLQINERLERHPHVQVLSVSFEDRRDLEIRKHYLNEADIVFLCLPDSASKESVSMINNTNTRVIDASTAYRTADDWAYGIPELSLEYRSNIAAASRVSNPGCHATAFILAVYPLVRSGIIPSDFPVTCQSITGYSGGGKGLISKYEGEETKSCYTKAPRPYALNLKHKHIPELMKHAGLDYEPLFLPIVSNYYKGLAVSVPIISRILPKKVNAQDVWELISSHYAEEQFVNVLPFDSSNFLYDGGMDITSCNDTNSAEIFVFGNEENILVMTRLDNLGKGASGAAVQNMNIMLGLPEETGLI